MGNLDPVRVVQPPPSPRPLWPEVLALPCRLEVALEVPAFTIRDLLSLEINSIVDTQRREGAHVPVCVNGVRLTEMV
jgi:flagellar motor switch/type III secretory pathway protein FliN